MEDHPRIHTHRDPHIHVSSVFYRDRSLLSYHIISYQGFLVRSLLREPRPQVHYKSQPDATAQRETQKSTNVKSLTKIEWFQQFSVVLHARRLLAGIFKIEDSVRVAKLWGERKNRPQMNYDKLSRSIRQYYKKGIIKKTVNSKRLVYQFCPAYMQWYPSRLPPPWHSARVPPIRNNCIVRSYDTYM